MNNKDIAARLVVVERAIVSLAHLVEELRQDVLVEERAGVLDYAHEPETLD